MNQTNCCSEQVPCGHGGGACFGGGLRARSGHPGHDILRAAVQLPSPAAGTGLIAPLLAFALTPASCLQQHNRRSTCSRQACAQACMHAGKLHNRHGIPFLRCGCRCCTLCWKRCGQRRSTRPHSSCSALTPLARNASFWRLPASCSARHVHATILVCKSLYLSRVQTLCPSANACLSRSAHASCGAIPRRDWHAA